MSRERSFPSEAACYLRLLLPFAAGVRPYMASGYHRDDRLPCSGIAKMLNVDGKMRNNLVGLPRWGGRADNGCSNEFRIRGVGETDSNLEANKRNAARRP